jgi:hypothetical protein
MSCLRVGQLAIGLASASALAQGGGLHSLLQVQQASPYFLF